MLPLVICAIPIYLLYQALGLLDTRLGLAIISCIINLPLALPLLVGFREDLPQEIEEAARVDGTSTFVILRSILIPLAWKIITTIAVSSSGSTFDAVRAAERAHAAGAFLVAITNRIRSPLTAVADIALLAASAETPLTGGAFAGKISDRGNP